MEPFLKVILPSSYNYDDHIVTIVDVHSRGVDKSWMTKRAAAGVFKSAEIKPEKGHTFLHLIAMGDSDYYGANRNGDIFFKEGMDYNFPEPKDKDKGHVKIAHGNKTRHWTFEKYAKVYRHHANKDPKKSCGDVVKSAHNNDMSRVELIIKVPDNDWKEDLEKVAKGQDLAVSMACKVPYDYCSICGNQATKRAEYCDHLKDHMTQITKSGHQVGAINDHMTFFDISRVTVPADRIAYSLLKVASAGQIISGAELAENYTLFPPAVGEYGDLSIEKLSAKIANIQKLSDMEKEVHGVISGKSKKKGDDKLPVTFHREVRPDLDEDDVMTLKSASGAGVDDILGGLASSGICLNVSEFARVILGDKYHKIAGYVHEAESILPGIYTRALEDISGKSELMKDFELGTSLLPRTSRDKIAELISSHSFNSDAVSERIIISTIRRLGIDKVAEFSGDTKSVSPVAVHLANLYSRYKMAFLTHTGALSEDNSPLTKLAIMQNYVQ